MLFVIKRYSFGQNQFFLVFLSYAKTHKIIVRQILNMLFCVKKICQFELRKTNQQLCKKASSKFAIIRTLDWKSIKIRKYFTLPIK